jgi:hypothetical protein
MACWRRRPCYCARGIGIRGRAQRCSGCATACSIIDSRRTGAGAGCQRGTTQTTCTWCRRLPDWVRRTGTVLPVALCWASRGARRGPISLAPRWSRSRRWRHRAWGGPGRSAAWFFRGVAGVARFRRRHLFPLHQAAARWRALPRARQSGAGARGAGRALHRLRMAPHLAQPLPFVMPSYRWWQTPFYGIGLKLYDCSLGAAGLGRTEFLNREQHAGRAAGRQRRRACAAA